MRLEDPRSCRYEKLPLLLHASGDSLAGTRRRGLYRMQPQGFGSFTRSGCLPKESFSPFIARKKKEKKAFFRKTAQQRPIIRAQA